MTNSGVTIIGLFGKIGAGKSTVASRFAELGAEVIDADALAHEALLADSVCRQLREHFGEAIFRPDGSVDRTRLAATVFGEHPQQVAALAALEQIVHPWVRNAIDGRLQAAQAAGQGGRGLVVVLDVPLLVQGGWHSRCDVVIGLACDDAIRHQRLAARGLSFGQISAREAAWEAGLGHDDADYQPDWTVDTAGDLAYTLKQVDRVWQRFRPHEHESSGELP